MARQKPLFFLASLVQREVSAKRSDAGGGIVPAIILNTLQIDSIYKQSFRHALRHAPPLHKGGLTMFVQAVHPSLLLPYEWGSLLQ